MKEISLSFFCPNGHWVTATDEGERFDVNQLFPCEICGATYFRVIKGWSEENPGIVPFEPIKEQNGVRIYDVKKLFALHPDKVDWEILLTEIPEDIKAILHKF